MSARDAILGKIRRSLGVTGRRRRAGDAIVDDRLDGAPKGVIPARGQLPPAERVALFARWPRRSRPPSSASTPPMTCRRRSPTICARTTCRRGCAWATIRCSPVCPGAQTTLAVSHGASDGDDAVGLSHAFAGVAETGTLVLASGPDNPTTLNFLPETHIVVLAAGDVVGDYETAWAKLRARYRQGRAAAHGQHDHRPVALGRHRADDPPRRPRPAPAAHRRGRLIILGRPSPSAVPPARGPGATGRSS